MLGLPRTRQVPRHAPPRSEHLPQTLNCPARPQLHSSRPARAHPPAPRSHPGPGGQGFRPERDGLGFKVCALPDPARNDPWPPQRRNGEERHWTNQLTSHHQPDKGCELLGPARSRACVRSRARNYNSQKSLRAASLCPQKLGAQEPRLGESELSGASSVSRECRIASPVTDRPTR